MLPALTAQTFVPTDMVNALHHAAGTMTFGLGTGDNVASLRNAINDVSADISAVKLDDACAALAIAAASLQTLGSAPASLPDHDGIGMILALTAQSLITARGQ